MGSSDSSKAASTDVEIKALSLAFPGPASAANDANEVNGSKDAVVVVAAVVVVVAAAAVPLFMLELDACSGPRAVVVVLVVLVIDRGVAGDPLVGFGEVTAELLCAVAMAFALTPTLTLTPTIPLAALLAVAAPVDTPAIGVLDWLV